jgi:hypothetical protein
LEAMQYLIDHEIERRLQRLEEIFNDGKTKREGI